MKEEWDKLSQETNQFMRDVSALLEMCPKSLKWDKITRAVNKSMEKMRKAHNRFDDFVTPVNSIKVNSPWADELFKTEWQFWKEYLIEQFGVHLRSRAELKSLLRLKEISNNDVDVAIKYLDYAMATRYPNFFAVDEKELKKANKNEQTETTNKPVIKLG